MTTSFLTIRPPPLPQLRADEPSSAASGVRGRRPRDRSAALPLAVDLHFLFGLCCCSAARWRRSPAIVAVQHYTADLPDYTQLANYDPPVVTRVHAGDGRLLAEYAIENRVFVPIAAIPKRVINAFLSAEDKNFYTHPGIDMSGMAAAALTNLTICGTRPAADRRLDHHPAGRQELPADQRGLADAQGARRSMLALRIEKAFSKDRILELYLNQIYLGAGNYGVAAAALNYFNKSLDELTIAEAPISPRCPRRRTTTTSTSIPKRRSARRNWVIGRMLEDGYITAAEAEAAHGRAADAARRAARPKRSSADYFAEEVRRELVAALRRGRALQGRPDGAHHPRSASCRPIADKVLRDGLVELSTARHGWRGPVAHIDARRRLAEDAGRGCRRCRPALRLAAGGGARRRCRRRPRSGCATAARARSRWPSCTWARACATHGPERRCGRRSRPARRARRPAMSIAVEAVAKDEAGKDYPAGTYGLRQMPEDQRRHGGAWIPIPAACWR